MSFLPVVGFSGSLALGTSWEQHVELEGPTGTSSSLRRENPAAESLAARSALTFSAGGRCAVM